MNYFPAAGIVPYVKINETVFYLLGKEKSNGKWSGFIGNYKLDDLSIYNTAIREFNEETCCIYKDYLVSIYNLLIKTEPIIVKNKNKNIYIFLLKFPERFFNNSTTYDFLKNLKIYNTNPEYSEYSEYSEKEKLGWFCERSINNNNDILHSLKIILKNKKL
jgi:hypothetical protein